MEDKKKAYSYEDYLNSDLGKSIQANAEIQNKKRERRRELDKLVADAEGREVKWANENGYWYETSMIDEEEEPFQPTEDSSQCFYLVIRHKLSIEHYGDHALVKYSANLSTVASFEPYGDDGYALREAICEAVARKASLNEAIR